MYSTYYLFYIFFTKSLVKEAYIAKNDVKLKKCVQSTYKDTNRVESGIVKCKK